MTCSACAANVEKRVAKLQGASNVSVNLLKNSMTLSLDDNCTEEQVIEAVRSIGYDASIKNAAPTEKAKAPAQTSYAAMKTRLTVSAALGLKPQAAWAPSNSFS